MKCECLSDAKPRSPEECELCRLRRRVHELGKERLELNKVIIQLLAEKNGSNRQP